MNATAIILAGGGSRRMPVDKTLMRVEGRPVIEGQLEILTSVFSRVLIVTNRSRLRKLDHYNAGRVNVVLEPVRDKGPLGGILSGLLLSGTDANFVTACDMPFINEGVIRHIMDRLDGSDAAVPFVNGFHEPLHAAYCRSCIGPIRERLGEGHMKVTSFFPRIRLAQVHEEELSRFDPCGRYTVNINTPAEMESAVEMHARLRVVQAARVNIRSPEKTWAGLMDRT